jgi:hypothetical protein
MKILLGELIQASRVVNKFFNKQMEFKLSYRLTKLAKKIASEISDFDTAKNKLILKYGTKDDKGNVSVSQEKMDEFSKELEPVLAEEIDLDVALIPFDLIEKSKIEISANELIMIEKFIEPEVKAEE